MTDEKYNGWTNYETWAVALWMDNDHSSHTYWRQQSDECYRETDDDDQLSERHISARSALADRIQEIFESDSPLADQVNVYSDLLSAALGSVDWYEIAEHLLEEIGQPEDPSLEIIDSYSRADAIEDGVLVDAGEMAKKAGFKHPVAITAAVWEQYLEEPEGFPFQDDHGWLWQMLYMLRIAILEGGSRDQVNYTLYPDDDGKTEPIHLKAICGSGDDAEPVITIMLPDED